jgi:hypothetical protein
MHRKCTKMLHAHGEQEPQVREPQCAQYEEQDVDDTIEHEVFEAFGQVAVLRAKETMRERKMTGTRRYLDDNESVLIAAAARGEHQEKISNFN